MRLDQLPKGYRVAYRHNPKHFQTNRFTVRWVGGRYVVYGIPKRGHKNFRVLGVLKNAPHT